MMQVMRGVDGPLSVGTHAQQGVSRFDVVCLTSTRYTVTDLRGNYTSGTDALATHDSFHFEVQFEAPLPITEEAWVKLMLIAPGDSSTTSMALFSIQRDTSVEASFFQPFKSVEGAPDRYYQFYVGYNLFYDTVEDVMAGSVRGVEFCIQNTHMRADRPELDPTWELRLDDDRFFKQHLPNCRGMPCATPINPIYGRGYSPHERAQGDPFWYGIRSGRIVYDNGEYFLLDDEEYEAMGGAAKLALTGGSGAYKQVGFDFGSKEGDPVNTNSKMRTGTQLENPVRAAYCARFPDVVAEERGWINGPRYEGYPRGTGMSPDGLLRDPSMTWDSVYRQRQEKWEAAWAGQGRSDAEIQAIREDLPNRGLLEIKVADGMRFSSDGTPKPYTDTDAYGYYMGQITWNMMVHDLYWARLVKLNLNGGELRVTTIYRDFDREKQLLDAMIKVEQLKTRDQIPLETANKCADAKAIKRKLMASARWFNDNKEKSSVVIPWDAEIVSKFFIWRRRTRARLAGKVSLKETLTARLLPAPASHMDVSVTRSQRIEHDLASDRPDAHQRVRSCVRSLSNAISAMTADTPIPPHQMDAVISDAIKALNNINPTEKKPVAYLG